MRTGLKTTEFWVGLVVSMIVVVQQAVWPDSPFPAEAFTSVVIWIIARSGEKVLTNGSTKRAWLTSEFWVTLAFSAGKYFFPDMPPMVQDFVTTYVVARPGIKAAKDFNLAELFKSLFKKK